MITNEHLRQRASPCEVWQKEIENDSPGPIYGLTKPEVYKWGNAKQCPIGRALRDDQNPALQASSAQYALVEPEAYPLRGASRRSQGGRGRLHWPRLPHRGGPPALPVGPTGPDSLLRLIGDGPFAFPGSVASAKQPKLAI